MTSQTKSRLSAHLEETKAGKKLKDFEVEHPKPQGLTEILKARCKDQLRLCARTMKELRQAVTG